MGNSNLSMGYQIPLITGTDKRKTLVYLSPSDLRISEFNPRRNRPDKDTDALAERMVRNGYELTRALWVYPDSEGLVEVFAGGTRLLAARRASLPEVPCILHEGFTDEELVLLSERDNENDEYHRPVSCVDTWLSYKALADLGWTQERIARAKGCTRSFVAMRLQLAELPAKALERFVTNDSLVERHARELAQLSPGDNLSPWLDRETAILEIIDAVCRLEKATAAKFKSRVDRYDHVIGLAQSFLQGLPGDWSERFLVRLAEVQARTSAKVQAIIDEITCAIAEEKRRQEEEVRIVAKEAERERIEAERRERLALAREAWWRDKMQLIVGDFAQVGPQLPGEAYDLIVTDPPYSREYLSLYELLARQAARLLRPGGSLLMMCGQSYLPEIFDLMTPHLRYVWTLAYHTPGGQAAQLFDRHVNTFWKPVLWFTTGDLPDFWIGDHVASNVNDNDKRFDRWGQSESGVGRLIGRFITDDTNRVLDPFVGGGVTAIVCARLGTSFTGIDIDSQKIEITRERVFSELPDHV